MGPPVVYCHTSAPVLPVRANTVPDVLPKYTISNPAAFTHTAGEEATPLAPVKKLQTMEKSESLSFNSSPFFSCPT